MKRIFLLGAMLLILPALKAQDIAGRWLSDDSTRVYEITMIGENRYMAVLKESSRKADSLGYIIINDLQYNTRKKKYTGIIYAVSDGQATKVRIRYNKQQPGMLVLKLNRMIFFDVSIKWLKAGEISVPASI